MVDTKKEKERDELHRAIWAIADELRGAVDGWDFKNYVLGTMFYRYISENLTSYVNSGEQEAGNNEFDYQWGLCIHVTSSYRKKFRCRFNPSVTPRLQPSCRFPCHMRTIILSPTTLCLHQSNSKNHCSIDTLQALADSERGSHESG